MRNQNNLQKINRNTILARGKIVEVNYDANNRSFILFIRNGGGRRHTFLKCYFKLDKFQLKKGTVVSISGHIENINTKNSYKVIVDSIQEEQTELATFFNKKPSFGFAYPNHFAKMFVFGKVIDKHLKPNSNWIEMIIEDNCKNRIKVQYSTKMRVNETNFEIGDYVYLSALPISIQKTFHEETFNFENYILEDIVIKRK
ncbi:TPA: hypothetical protein U2C31_000309 [Streptococcus suis]|uniref:hypothetical protein n=1 Tax=Streptococcus suis TaxID=1307 RepID=UPI0005CD7CFB|nr:hypothetical protein [Streptococcus suis]NQH31469.1 hypothetical protein [Streptococcus suis]NQP00442.1 hypothetical protein [Streptococcus suis]NQP48376.1 hypothetical protein [Streptococcus suis]NQP56531.1 hypothetical protein [Streptococcus suis]CYV02359.1 Uncharacterised protein [Streptococcus suis]